MHARYSRQPTSGTTDVQDRAEREGRPARSGRHRLGLICLVMLWAMPPLILLLGARVAVPVYEDFGIALPVFTTWQINTAALLTGNMPGAQGYTTAMMPTLLMYVGVYLGTALVFIVPAVVLPGRAGRTIARLGAVPPILATLVIFAGWMLPLASMLDSLSK